MKLKFFLILLPLLGFSEINFTSSSPEILEGDTFNARNAEEGVIYKIRLYGVDCPEVQRRSLQLGQPFSEQAKEFTSNFCKSHDLLITIKGKDLYGHYFAIVSRKSDGLILNEELLKAGLAWHYKKLDKNPAWAQLEQTAKSNKVGLWADEKPMEPWFKRTLDD